MAGLDPAIRASFVRERLDAAVDAKRPLGGLGSPETPAVTAGPPNVSVLPYPDPSFNGVIGRTTEDSKPDFPQPISAPEAHPMSLLILTDDVGFGASSAFGGPIPTPTLEALAANGLKYNAFNTTALCSPTRAALITGRDQHRVHTGIIMERSLGYPGYDSLMPKSAGTAAEILRGNGYSTAWFGKNHNVPAWQSSAAGPFDLWPTGLGFWMISEHPLNQREMHSGRTAFLRGSR